MCCELHALTELLVADHLGLLSVVAVYPELYAMFLHQLVLMLVADDPVVEIPTLVLPGWFLLAVVNAQSLHLMTSESLLNLPSGHVSIGNGSLGPQVGNIGCSRANEDAGLLLHRVYGGLQLRRVEVFCKLDVRPVAKEHIIGHKPLCHPSDRLFWQHQLAGVYHPPSCLGKGMDEILFIGATIEVDGPHRLIAPQLTQRGYNPVPAHNGSALGGGAWKLVVIAFSHPFSLVFVSMCEI